MTRAKDQALAELALAWTRIARGLQASVAVIAVAQMFQCATSLVTLGSTP